MILFFAVFEDHGTDVVSKNVVAVKFERVGC